MFTPLSPVGNDFKFMVDANHCYTSADALYVGRGLEELDAFWLDVAMALTHLFHGQYDTLRIHYHILFINIAI